MTSHQVHLSHPKYRPDIDGLRAIAVLSVVAFHAFPSEVRGCFIGVDVFFVISGYLISTIIFENLDKGTFSFSEFYSRRIRRIFPSLLLVLIACFAFGWFALLADEYKQLGKHIAGGAGFVSNFVLWKEAGYFDNSAETKPLLHLWSLGIEEQFYIVWPLVLWFAWKRKFNLLTITVVVAIATFILNVKGIKHDMVATFYSPQTRFWELLSGSLLAWFTLYKKDAFANIKSNIDVWLSRVVYSENQEGDGKTLSNVLSLVGLFLLLYGFWQINKELSFPGKWALVPVLGAVLIITAGSKAWVNRTILSNNLLVWFGLISFPLYLWHWPILSFARIVESEMPSRNIRIVAVVLSIVLAWLTYKLVERPLRFGQHNKIKVTVLVVFMATVGYVGYNTFERDGLSFRNKVRSAQKFIQELSTISNIYDFFEYNKIIRSGICHSVSLENFSKNKCLDLRAKNIFLWGDSYAASLYSGLSFFRDKYFSNVGIIQMTDGNGPPFYGEGKTDDGKTLTEANENRLRTVAEINPELVLITWMVGGSNSIHTKEGSVSELLGTINKIKLASPHSKIIVIGPFPQWSDTLLKQLLNFYVKNKSMPPFSMRFGLVDADRAFDRYFSEKMPQNGVIYISAYDAMCDARGCITRLSNNASELTSVDFGHLTVSGSLYLVEKLKDRIFNFD